MKPKARFGLFRAVSILSLFCLLTLTMAGLWAQSNSSSSSSSSSQNVSPAGTSAPSSNSSSSSSNPNSQSSQPAAAAPAQQTPVIAKVEIRGNRVVSTNTIVNKVRTRQGQPLVQETVNDDVKRLYATGFFQDVRVDVQ